MNTEFNRTKIIATIGPASNNYDMMLKLAQEGVDIFRLNFSHGTHEDHAKVIKIIRQINEEHNLNLTTLQDLQGPKIRTGLMDNDGVEIVAGEEITLVADKTLVGNAKQAGLTYLDLPRDVESGEMILLDDGKLELKVKSTNKKDKIVCEIVYGGKLKSRKGINLPYTKISAPSLTEKDRTDLEFGLKNDVDWIALSFVRHADDIHDLRRRIEEKGKTAKIIAKIEKPEALENIDDIIAATDAVMVARGDMGVEVIMEEVPMIQKNIVQKCNAAAKPVIIATQMMESMIDNPRPTRAETNDVANAVLDGADVVMLSAETAAGKYPVEVIKSMSKTVTLAEQSEEVYYRFENHDENSKTFLNDKVVTSACTLARSVKAKALIGMTKSGYTAFQLAKHRPKAGIFIFSEDKYVLSQLNLIWGVRCFSYNKFTTTDGTIEDIKNILMKKGLVKSGDVLINTASMPIYEKQRTNMVKLTVV